MQPARSGAVAGVVLAAGASTRMGRNKLLIEIDGETLLRRAVRQAIGADLDPVIVVLGHEAGRARDAVAGLPCRPVVNEGYMHGVNASLRAGIGAVPPEAVATVVVLADMPLVTAPMIATLVERYRATAVPLVVSEYLGVIAPPTLYDRALFGELLATDAEGCVRRVVRRHEDEALRVAWPPLALTDLDVPEDVERVKALIRARVDGDRHAC